MGWICWIFSFIFNAQRKLGGKFKLLDRHCDYFSSFGKISAHITTQRKGKMILMAPFLFSFFLLLPSHYQNPAQWGPAIQVRIQDPARAQLSVGQEGDDCITVPWASSTPSCSGDQWGPQAATQEPASNPAHASSILNSTQSPEVCPLPRVTYLSFDLTVCPKGVAGLLVSHVDTAHLWVPSLPRRAQGTSSLLTSPQELDSPLILSDKYFQGQESPCIISNIILYGLIANEWECSPDSCSHEVSWNLWCEMKMNAQPWGCGKVNRFSTTANAIEH